LATGGPSRWLERIFHLEEAGTTPRRELLGGLTTLLTMSYVFVVHPQILAEAGMPFEGVLFATCVSAAVATLAMAFWANYPIALAPGMGLNAYFAYVAVPLLAAGGLSGEEAWQAALGAVLISGIVFFLLSIFRIRVAIMEAVPRSLKLSVGAGIGLFIAFIGLQNAGIVVADPGTLVKLGDLTSPGPVMAMAGLVASLALLARRVRGAILIGIVAATLTGFLLGEAEPPSRLFSLPDVSSTFLKLDLLAALGSGFVAVVFVFLFVDMFDTVGTLIAVGEQGGFTDEKGRLPRAGRALQADATGTVVGALLGTSTVTSYVESAAGISEGARTGLANIVVAAGFLLFIFLSPIIGAVPLAATSPALLIIGALMTRAVARVPWDDTTESIPAFLTLATIPLTFSITEGIAVGFLSYAVMKGLGGRAREVHPLVWVLAAVFLLRYVFL